MAKDFFVILTETGRAKLANAVALGRTVSLTHCAVGDGAGQQVTPDAAQDALVRETYRAQLNTLEMDPDNPAYIVAELVIPSEQGGWTIREAGVFDADGDLFAVGNLPETYKPQIAEGSAAELRVRLVLEVSNTAAVELKVDPTVVLASRSYVNAQVVEVRALLETHTTRTDDPHHTIPEGGEPPSAA
jgi:phage-related tail fiber protein